MNKTSLLLSLLCLSLFGQISWAQNENYILLVVDIQDFDNVEQKIPDTTYQEFLSEVNQVIVSFPPDQVAYIKNMQLALSISFNGIKTDTLSLPELDKNLWMVNQQIYIKSKGDSFTAEGIDRFLQKYPHHKILVIGLIADGCIYSTLKSGCKKGYEMFIVPEAILAWSEENKEKYLNKYYKKGVKNWPETSINK